MPLLDIGNRTAAVIDRGEEVVVNVANQLPETTTVHWHGLLIPSGMDGVGRRRRSRCSAARRSVCCTLGCPTSISSKAKKGLSRGTR